MSGTLDTRLIIYALVFAGGFMLLQAVMGMARQATVGVKLANARLRKQEKAISPEELLAEIRRDRGLNQDGRLHAMNHYIGTLVLRSGLPLGQYKIYFIMAGAALVGGLVGWFTRYALVWAGLGFVVGLVLPIFVLKFLVKRRADKAVAQLPEALDVIVRSLRAGHPVSVAMGLVGREMPDPIGSEFGTAADEISYGSEVSAAIQRMADRVGQEDFDLFAAMIRLQERTGGNLAELLAASSKTIRDRQKMRLKIKAASAEGRASAMILNAAPIGLFLMIKTTSPEFFGDLSGDSLVKKALIGVTIWMLIGNLVMRKMINFRI